MDQTKRILEMERALDDSADAVQKLLSAMEGYAAVQGRMQALFEYYFGPMWRADYEADSRGELPGDLKRGVLTEDAVYDLFSENQKLLEQLCRLAEAHKKYPD